VAQRPDDLALTVAAVADAAMRFRRIIGAREEMTVFVCSLKDRENGLVTVAPRRQAV
jgi:hypothetical protein